MNKQSRKVKIEAIADVIIFPDSDDKDYQLKEIQKIIGLTDDQISEARQKGYNNDFRA